MVEGALKENALKGQTILVTGGGTGLGKSMASYFSQLGANLVICSRKLAVLEETAHQIQENTGGQVLPISCDVTDPQQVAQMHKQALERFGQIHGLVNNAAGNFISPTKRLSPNAFSRIIDIVLKGTINCTLEIGKHWIDNQQKGNVLNIITTYAFTGSSYVVPSAAAKGGVLSLTRSLAVEWGAYGIRHNAIAPGPFPTEGAWQRLLPGELAQKLDLTQRVPLKRLGQHQELANLAAFLISPFAEFINGEIISIDGGEWLQGAGQLNGLSIVPENLWESIEQNIRKNNKK